MKSFAVHKLRRNLRHSKQKSMPLCMRRGNADYTFAKADKDVTCKRCLRVMRVLEEKR